MKRFKKIYIEITNLCNLSCSFCPKTKRKSTYMSQEHFERIIGEITPFTDYVYLHVKGEPLLHPMLGSFLSICSKHGLKVNITTNGTLIKKALPELRAKEALRQINFSLHSFGGGYEEEEAYSPKEACSPKEAGSSKEAGSPKETGSHKDTYSFKESGRRDRYLEDILEGADELLCSTATNISYRFWNMDKIEDTHRTPHKINATGKYLNSLEKAYGYKGSLKEDVKPGRGIKLSERVYISRDYEFTWPALTEEEDDGCGFCYGLRTHVGILSDGTVIPCCLDGEGVISLGNIITTPFKEIIDSPRAKAIYDGFSGRRAVEVLCRKCGYRKKFGSLK